MDCDDHGSNGLDRQEDTFSGEFVSLQKKRKLPSWMSELVSADCSQSNSSSSNSNRQTTKKPKTDKNTSTKPSVSRRKVPNTSQTSTDNRNETIDTGSKAEIKQQPTEKLSIEGDVVGTSINKAKTQDLRNTAAVSKDEEDEISKIKKAISIADTLSDPDDDWNESRKLPKARNTVVSDESDNLDEEFNATTASKLVNVQKNQIITSQQSKTETTASTSQQRSSVTAASDKDLSDNKESKKQTKLTKKQSLKKCPYGAKCYRYYFIVPLFLLVI